MPGLAVLAQHVLSGLLDRKSHCSVSNIMISFYFYFFPLADAHMSVGKEKSERFLPPVHYSLFEQ